MNKPITTLFHLGLNRNKIRQTALTQIVKVFPNLMCLDLSFNDLCELDPAIIWIKKLTLMRMLSLEGNPLFFTPHYRIIMVEQMPNLKVIDSITVPVDQRRAAEQAAKEREQKYSSTPVADSLTPIQNNMKIELEFRVLKNIDGGCYLIPDENCTFDTEKLDSIPEEHKSSTYWVTYTNHNESEIQTVKKSYIRHFQVEENLEKPGNMVGKTDLDYQLCIEQIPSIEVRDWLMEDVVITLWESRPIILKVKEDGSEVEVDRV